MKRLLVIALLLGASMAAHAAPPTNGVISNCWDLSALALNACAKHAQPRCTTPAATNDIWLRSDGAVVLLGADSARG